MTLVLLSFKKMKSFSLRWAVARWCHVAAPHHHVDHDLGQHDDNVAFVYLLRLHPLLGHLLRAKLNESKPSWGTYPTMVAELISGNVGCMSGRNRKFDQFQISWPPFFTTCLLQPDFTILRRASFTAPEDEHFQEKYFSWLYLFWFPVLERKEKVPRQLVALCLVRGLVHNTCVFLPDQADVSRCKAMAGDVVLHLIRGKCLAEKHTNVLIWIRSKILCQ